MFLHGPGMFVERIELIIIHFRRYVISRLELLLRNRHFEYN